MLFIYLRTSTARLPLMSDCPAPIHPNNPNLYFNYSFLSLSSAKLQLKTFLLFSRDSFLFLLLLSFLFLLLYETVAWYDLNTDCMYVAF